MAFASLPLLVLLAAPPSAADAHVERLLATAQRWDTLHQQEPYTWLTESISEILDGEGRVEERETNTWQTVRVEGRPYHRHVARNGRPLDGTTLQQAKQEEREFTERARRGDRTKERGFRFDRTLMERFVFTVVGRAERHGTRCELLRFAPRDRTLPELNPTDRVLNRLHGELCVHPSEGGIVDLHAWLPEPVSVGLVLGKVSRLEIRHTQQRVADGVWAPESFSMEIHARALIRRIHRRTQFQIREVRREAR